VPVCRSLEVLEAVQFEVVPDKKCYKIVK
jgi:hypothetical protein